MKKSTIALIFFAISYPLVGLIVKGFPFNPLLAILLQLFVIFEIIAVFLLLVRALGWVISFLKPTDSDSATEVIPDQPDQEINQSSTYFSIPSLAIEIGLIGSWLGIIFGAILLTGVILLQYFALIISPILMITSFSAKKGFELLNKGDKNGFFFILIGISPVFLAIFLAIFLLIFNLIPKYIILIIFLSPFAIPSIFITAGGILAFLGKKEGRIEKQITTGFNLYAIVVAISIIIFLVAAGMYFYFSKH